MKKALIIFITLFAIAVILVLRPVTTSIENCEKITGIVTYIGSGPSNDIVIKLSNDQTTYYINRGLEQDLEIESLEEALLQKNVHLYVPRHWTPLDPMGRLKHVAELATADKTFFSELRE